MFVFFEIAQHPKSSTFEDLDGTWMKSHLRRWEVNLGGERKGTVFVKNIKEEHAGRTCSAS